MRPSAMRSAMHLAWLPLASSLWGRLGEDLPRERPEDFEALRFYIYELPGRFHGELLEEMEQLGRDSGSNCDFFRSICTEDIYVHRYSMSRQFGAEVILLRKLLASSARTWDPQLADFFVVPYLAGTDCRLHSPNPRCSETDRLDDLWSHLHFYDAAPHRHLFLGTKPISSLPLVLQSQELLVSEGAAMGQPGHLQVPSASSEDALQPKTFDSEELERDLLLWLVQTPNNAMRMEVQRQLLNHSHSSLEAYGARGIWVEEGSRGAMPSQHQMMERLRRSVLCPALPAESTAGLVRLFDRVRAGCLPVVLAFSTAWGDGDGSGISWWRQEGPPIEWSLPFWEQIPWAELVLQVWDHEVASPGFVETCLQLTEEELRRKQQFMSKMRYLLTYDLEGGRRDAFSLFMDSIRSALPKLQRPGFPRVCHFLTRAQNQKMLSASIHLTEKAWAHSFGEISCATVERWRAPLLRNGQTALFLEEIFAKKMWRPAVEKPSLWLLASDRRPVQKIVSTESTVICGTTGLPPACHDTFDPLDFCFNYVAGPFQPVTTCRALPQLPQHSERSTAPVVVTWCVDFDAWTQELEALTRWNVSAVWIYESCGWEGARAVLHHVHSLMDAKEDTQLLLVQGGSHGVPASRVKEIFSKLKSEASMEEFLIFEGPASTRPICKFLATHISFLCPFKGFGTSVMAIAFRPSSLVMYKSEWEVASTTPVRTEVDQWNFLVTLVARSGQAGDLTFRFDQTCADGALSVTCLKAFSAEHVKLTGVPIAWGGRNLAKLAQHCLVIGEYAVVETGLPMALFAEEDPPNLSADMSKWRTGDAYATLLQALGSLGTEDNWRRVEVIGVCVPWECRNQEVFLAWHFTWTETFMAPLNSIPLPGAPMTARVRLRVKELQDLRTGDELFQEWKAEHPNSDELRARDPRGAA